MRLPKPNVRKARIEIVPMIDTIFFLLVFFMMSTLSMVKMQGLGLTLPTDSPKGPGKAPDRLTLSISPTGHYALNSRELDVTSLPAEFRAQLAAHPGAVVVVNVASTQPTQALISTMDILNEIMTESGNSNPILIATPKPQEAGGPESPREKGHAGR
jgi:biopolymer transport protein ExbD